MSSAAETAANLAASCRANCAKNEDLRAPVSVLSGISVSTSRADAYMPEAVAPE
jgi:hypothetical protein